MVARYSEEAWNKHVRELIEEFRPCLFDGNKVLQDCLVSSPSKAELEDLRSIFTSLSVRDVVDFGCGMGLFLGLFQGASYTGVDLTLKMVESARLTYPEGNFFVGGRQELSRLFPAGVDLVFTRAVVQHNLEPEKSELVKSFHSVLRPGGYYLFHEHSFLQPSQYVPGVEKGRIVEYMAGFGFSLVEHRPDFTFLFRKD